MDLGPGIWLGSNGGLRALYNVRPTLAAAIGAGGIRRVEPAGLGELSRRLLGKKANHEPTFSGAGGAETRAGVRRGCSSGRTPAVRALPHVWGGVRRGVS